MISVSFDSNSKQAHKHRFCSDSVLRWPQLEKYDLRSHSKTKKTLDEKTSIVLRERDSIQSETGCSKIGWILCLCLDLIGNDFPKREIFLLRRKREVKTHIDLVRKVSPLLTYAL